MSGLIQRVQSTLRERSLIRPGGKLLVAVSGGVDSMVLLHILHVLASENGSGLAIAHFNHQLRGRSSDLDAALVGKTAESLKLPLFGGQGDVKSFARESGLSVEMAARKLRHEFLAATAREGQFPTIALAHHADDQVELFFLRLLRGAGGDGLAGMKWRSPSPMDKRVTLIRPLLDVSKAELEEFARACGIKWRPDATNQSLAVPRNRVRHELLPLLRRHYQPGLTGTVSRVIEIVRAESDLVGEMATQWLAGRTGFQPVNRALQRERSGKQSAFPATIKFDELPLAVQRRVILGQLQTLGLPPDFEWVEQLRSDPGNPVNVGMNLRAMRDAQGIVALSARREAAEFDLAEQTLEVVGKGEANLGGTQIAWELVGSPQLKQPRQGMDGCELFDAGAIGPKVLLRHWRPGDRFQPLGMKTAVKLQDLFTNAKIPRERRRKALVASAKGEIFWVEGLRMAEHFKLTGRTKQGLLWRWSKAG